LQSALHAVTNRHESFEAESTIPLWKEAYYSLVMLEKMIHEFHDECFAKHLEVNFFVLPIKYKGLILQIALVIWAGSENTKNPTLKGCNLFYFLQGLFSDLAQLKGAI